MSRPTHSTKGDYAPKNVMRHDSGGAGSIGEYGTIEIDLCDSVLRIHNDVVPGGVAFIPLVPNCGPNTVVAPAVTPADIDLPADNGPTQIMHNVGAYPVVQVINAAGTVLTGVQVTHNSENAFTVTLPTGVAGTVIYRF